MSNNHQNKVELLGYYGSDLTHALSAWTSTNRDLSDEKRNRVGKLLKMLAENGHETPFEKSMLHFLITTDIASHIHLIKHRVAVSVNTESSRYKEYREDKYYLPQDWDENTLKQLEEHTLKSYELYHNTIKKLTDNGMKRSRAKESARFFLPYNIQLTCDVSFNFRSFIHFQRLRNDEHAQVEIREVAQKMLECVRNTNAFPLTLKAFGYGE
jgi:thymidylate synthase (FAD)